MTQATPVTTTMWTVLLVYICLTEAIDESYIMMGDRIFSGPDERVLQILERRRALSGDAQAAIQRLEQYMNTPPRDVPEPRATFDGTPHQELVMYNKVFELPELLNDTESMAPMFVVTKLIKVLMNNVIHRLHEIQPLLSKYASDPRLRYGRVVCGLNVWRKEITNMMMRVAIEGKRLPIRHHVVNYMYLLAKNIDIYHVNQYLRFKDTDSVHVAVNTNTCNRCSLQGLK